MSVDLCIAKPASGKTRACIQRVKDVLLSHPLSEIWVIVPDRLQAASFRRQLAYSGGVLGTRVGTFGDLYHSILDRSGSYVPVASAPLLHRIIQDIVDVSVEQGKLLHFSTLRTFPGFILALRDSFAELKRSLISPEQFLEFTQSGSRAQQELAFLYFTYQSRLIELGWADPEGLSWLAVEALETHPKIAASTHLIVIDGFDSFTGAQHRALQLLSGQIDKLLITFPGEANSKRPVHRRFASTIEKLIQELSPQISTIPTIPSLPLNALHLENSLFELGNHSVKSAENAFLLEARSPADEAREALRWIKACVLRDSIALSDCAVFTPNPDVYNPFIRAIATEFGIPVHFTQGAALAASPAIAALLNLLALPAQNFKTRMLFNSLRSPYFDFGLDANIINVLEEISRRARIIESQEQWQETWERLIPPDVQDQSYLDDERILPSLPRGDKAKSLRHSLQACFDMFITPIQIQSYTGWVTWLEDVLERLNFYRTAENERDEMACEVFRETLRALVLSESVTGERETDYASFLSKLQSTLNGIGLPEPRLKGQSALLIGRMVEARGIRFKAVALLGFSEGLFPETERSDPFLDESLRQALGLERRLDREQAGLFYQAVTRTDQYLLITRPYLSDKGENWEASPFWKDVQKRFDKSALRVVRPDDMPSLNDAASTQELLFWAVRHKGLPGRFRELEPRWQALRHARDVLRARRAKRPESMHEGFVPSIASELSKRYAPDKIWSASRLEAYGNCPQQFYIKAALGLEPRTLPELGMDISQLGILLHKILEETYRTAADPSDASSLLAVLPNVAHRLFVSAPDEYGFRPSSLWAFEQEQLLVKLQTTIEALCNESDGWTPISYEQKFGIGSFPPLAVDLGPEKMLLRGVIDRLDRNVNGEIRIVDYKTGSSHLDSKALKNGARLQLPLYALAVHDALHLGNVSEGIYWKIQGAEAGSLKLSSYKSENGQGVDVAIQDATEHLLRILTGIRAAEFPPLPPKGGCPSYCPATQWCWHYEPRWSGEQ